MAKKVTLTQDTVVVFGEIPVGEYRKYFLQAIGEQVLGNGGMDFQNWLFSQGGKTLKEATDDFLNPPGHEKMQEFLTERRFEIVSEADKNFLIAFDKEMSDLGYDFGGEIRAAHSWGARLSIIYGKTGTKSRPCPARIHIRDDGILMQLYFTKIDAHREYIESAPPNIKEVFTGVNNPCKSCRSKCGPKEYTIDGQFISVCRDAPFWFRKPCLEMLPDYANLLAEFYS